MYFIIFLINKNKENLAISLRVLSRRNQRQKALNLHKINTIIAIPVSPAILDTLTNRNSQTNRQQIHYIIFL